MRRKLPEGRTVTPSPSLRIQTALVLGLLLSPWVGALVGPGQASAAPVLGLPPGYSTCYSQDSPAGWVQAISEGEDGSGMSHPSSVCLQDGWLSYDSTLYVVLLPSVTTPTAVYIVIEQYTPGTETVYQNVTSPNGTVIQVPVQVPMRQDPYWSNATITAYPGAQTGVGMPLNYSGSATPMILSVGEQSYQRAVQDGATWTLYHESPPVSSLAWIYDQYGLNMALYVFGVILVIFLGVAFVAAARFAKRFHRAPRVPYHWWPVVWIATPILLFLFDFVQFDHVTGWIGPIVFPAVITVAAFPYMPNLWADAKMCVFVSYDGKSQRSQNAPLAVLPLVTSAHPVCCAPETWGELWHCMTGSPLPSVSTVKVKKGQIEVEYEIDPIAVTYPIGAWYQTDAKLLAWQNHDHSLVRVRHHYARVDKIVQRQVVGSDGTVQVVNVTKKTIFPRTVLGHLDWYGPQPEEVLQMQTAVRTVEQEATRNRILQVWVAELRSRNMEMVAQAREETEDRMEAERDLLEKPMTEEEMRELVAVDHKKREPTSAEVGDVREPERAERERKRSS